jgi:hypothetical protein
MNALPSMQDSMARNSSHAGLSHSDETWSMGLAFAAMVLVPAYFLLAPYWNPDYSPIRPWVWAVPGVSCILYLFAQFWALMHSAGRSDDIGMKDTIVSLLAALSCFATFIAMLIFWGQGSYHFGAFQAMTIITITVTAFGELIFTAWVRYLVNRRYFAGVPHAGT